MSDKLGKMMEDIGNLELDANKENTVKVVVGYNPERDTLLCVDVPASEFHSDTETITERLKALPVLEKNVELSELRESYDNTPIPKTTIDSLPNRSGMCQYDELDYATLVTPDMESKLYPHQIEMLKGIAKGKNTIVITPKHNAEYHLKHGHDLIDTMVILNNQKHALHEMITVVKERPKSLENKLRLSYEHSDVSVMELFSNHIGAWKEPTHVRVKDGVTTRYYLLLPTMLSVQIALLCGFELKQSIERVTHKTTITKW